MSRSLFWSPKSFLFLLLLLSLVGLHHTSCSDGTACQRNTDCPSKQFCDRAGKCNQECTNNRDCSSREKCNRRGQCERARDKDGEEKTTDNDAGVKDEGGTSGCANGKTKPCYDGPAGTAGTGACREGTQTCENGAWGACTGAVTPQTETCNGKDDDCDGQTDEELKDCGCKQDQDCPPERSSCRGGRCILLCQNNSVCPDTERCESGFCQACPNGSRRSANEVCDGKDNNCNGQVDENIPQRSCYTGPSNTKNVGACREGKQSCQPSTGTWDKCVGEKTPQTEVCNDRQDNDCDGTTDTDCDKLHRSCKDKAECSTGQNCLFVNQQGVCFQDCTNDKGVCAKNTDGRTTCKPITADGSISICVKIAAPSAKCELKQSIICADSQVCGANDTCVTPQRAKIGNACDGSLNPPILCESGASCVSANKKNRCLKSCKQDSDCPGGNFKCFSLQSGNGICIETCADTSGSCTYGGFSCQEIQNKTFACLP